MDIHPSHLCSVAPCLTLHGCADTGGPATVLDGDEVTSHTRSFSGMADDFKLMRCALAAGETETLPRSPGPQVILGINGVASTNGGEDHCLRFTVSTCLLGGTGSLCALLILLR